MPDGKDSVAQAFYLAQLQACKGKCQCNVCKLLRRAADLQMQSMLKPEGASPLQTEESIIPGVSDSLESGL